MDYPAKPIAGQPAGPFLADTTMWTQILDMLAAWRNGEIGELKTPKGIKTQPIGISDLACEPGQVKQLGPIEDTAVSSTEQSVLDLTIRKPVFNLIDPVWNTEMDALVIINKNIPPFEPKSVGGGRFVVAPVIVTNAEHRWAMIDPTDPTKLKSSTSGKFRLLDSFSDPKQLSVLDTTEEQPTWQYRIKADDDLDDVELQDLDGVVFANTIKLKFLGPQPAVKADDVGMCVNVGNEFYAQAGFTCESLCDCEDYLPASPNICPDP